MSSDAHLNRLIAAWESWDREPGNKHTAARMVDACNAYVGVSSVEFRRHIAAARRHGMSRRDAIRSWDHEW